MAKKGYGCEMSEGKLAEVVGKLKILLDTNIFDPSEHIEIYPPNTVEVMEGERDEPNTTRS